jgi:hypothetical protein
VGYCTDRPGCAKVGGDEDCSACKEKKKKEAEKK